MLDRPTRHRRALGWAGLALALVMVACGDAGVDRVAAPDPPPSYRITLREFTYTPDQEATTVPAGRVNFELFNDGEIGHQPALIFVPDDFPPMAEQVRGDERRPVRILAANSGVPAGVTAAVAVDLEPGRRYAFLCLAQAADGRQHSQHGMAWEFRTPPADGADPAVPEADART